MRGGGSSCGAGQSARGAWGDYGAGWRVGGRMGVMKRDWLCRVEAAGRWGLPGLRLLVALARKK